MHLALAHTSPLAPNAIADATTRVRAPQHHRPPALQQASWLDKQTLIHVSFRCLAVCSQEHFNADSSRAHVNRRNQGGVERELGAFSCMNRA
jgi:hypothetical protein